MKTDLFEILEDKRPRREDFAPGAVLLREFVSPYAKEFIHALEGVIGSAPLRHMVTPGGFRMSVAMTNCGTAGWITDKTGYRYTGHDPITGQAWPPMPAIFLHTAVLAAREAGFPAFSPDACLINRYEPGAKMSLHQDKDEYLLDQPVVSLSFGLPATFLFGGLKRNDRKLRIPLAHGDAVIWGGPARLRFHGIQPLKEGCHPLLGNCRINLTFRTAL